LNYVREVHEPWTRPPDLTVYLDLDPETAARRSGATNKFETADYLADVRDNYERLVDDDPERFVRVDAAQSPDTVYTAVREAILERR
jgi:dTMP kinase